jgi:hypothetical protein
LTETEFIDAVSRNLQRGRVLLVVAGDGITESTEALTEYLQQHAGVHFTLALVQMAIYEDGDGGSLIVPSIPARTINIVRGIVEIRDGKLSVSAPPTVSKPETLTEEQYFEQLDRMRSGTEARLRAFLLRCETIGVTYSVKRILLLRAFFGGLGSQAIAAVDRNGNVDSSQIWWHRDKTSSDVIEAFQAEWIAGIPGAEIKQTPKTPRILVRGRELTIWDLLDHQDSWLLAAERFQLAVLKGQELDSGDS